MKHEEGKACQELMRLDQAILAAVLSVTGEVTVQREAVNRHLREATAVRAVYDEAAGTYRLWTEVKTT